MEGKRKERREKRREGRERDPKDLLKGRHCLGTNVTDAYAFVSVCLLFVYHDAIT